MYPVTVSSSSRPSLSCACIALVLIESTTISAGLIPLCSRYSTTFGVAAASALYADCIESPLYETVAVQITRSLRIRRLADPVTPIVWSSDFTRTSARAPITVAATSPSANAAPS